MSGGEKARVALARAIASDPAILILDEATAMLDEELEHELWANLARIRRDKTTIVLSHDEGNIPKIYQSLILEGRKTVVLGAHREEDASTFGAVASEL